MTTAERAGPSFELPFRCVPAPLELRVYLHSFSRYRAVKRTCATVPFKVFPDPSSGARPWVQVLNAVNCLTVVV